MKKAILAALALVCVLACNNRAPERMVMARAVPERADDFVFENDLIAGRFYGKALEGNPTSPGVDVWVKLPGRLVADEWYDHAVNEDPKYYHRDHGGKDCYKVAVSLGGGASAPYLDGKLCFPATNYRSYEILEDTLTRVRFALEYPEWEAAEGITVSLRKEVTLSAGSYFADVADYYTFTGTETLRIAAGVKLHDVEKTCRGEGRFAIWEHASDQSVEPEDGMLGLAVIGQNGGVEGIVEDEGSGHMLVYGSVRSGEPFRYSFGSCWSKGNIKTADDWFALAGRQ
ncbi:MAG: DUF4861 domain-containing protein [Bacteroidales bacterium]|nr:DUF4861 domain-containing protein [Bacteroidales bacterium]